MRPIIFRYGLLLSCLLSMTPSGYPQTEKSVYIPYDVADAVRELDRIIAPAAKEQIFSRPIGMQVRNRWRLWNDDSRLARYFRTKGIYNADLMWGIIADAFTAKSSKKQFVLRESLRQALSTYASSVNIPSGLVNTPPDFGRLHISHYIQRDDLSAIHVFATNDGKPEWVFIPDGGWFPVDAVISNMIEAKEALVVPQLPRNQ